MSMIQDLNSKGIRLKSYSPGNQKTLCPRCSHTRKNKSDPCLSVTIESSDLALYNCHNCYWQGSAGLPASGQRQEEPKRKEYVKPEVKRPVNALPQHILDFLQKRGISKEVAERNRLYFDEKRKSLAFPYFINDEIVNVKYRTIDKKFQMEKGAKLVFYGLDDVANSEEIIIVEGEFDKLALEVCGITNVISVPNGAPPPKNHDTKSDEPVKDSRFEYLTHSEELLKKAKKVVIAVDNDKAGIYLRHELARRIGVHKTWFVEWPEAEKDANKCLEVWGIEDVLFYLNSAKPYPIKGLYRTSDFKEQLIEYFQSGMSAGASTGFENLDRLYTVMPGEVDIWTGIPNSGKSELLDAILINLAKFESWKGAVFSPENGKEAHAIKLIEKIIQLPSDPKAKNRMSVEQMLQGAEWINEKIYHIVSDNDDEDELPSLSFILDMAKAAVLRDGIKIIIIDPWNEIEQQRPVGLNETDYISKAMSRIKRFAKNHLVHVCLVAHPKNMTADKDGKFRVPGAYDISGGAHWANKADNIITVHRSEDITDCTEVHVKKIRKKHVGKKGMCKLKYLKETGLYEVYKADTMPYVDYNEPDTVVFESE